jgi:peptide/nickel transport system substrate-binding protein
VRGNNFAALAVLVAAIVLAASGCGGSSDGGSTAGGTDPVPSSTSGGGSAPVVLHGTAAAFPDSLDPALSISLEGANAMWNTYVPLLTYEHASGPAGAKLIPGLARALPKVSGDGLTYTLFLRKGLKYSDGTPILASDWTHSVERLLTLNSGGSSFFYGIVGAQKFQETKKGGIPGIETDDKSGRITIHLTEPRGTFDYELASLWSAPLPADTPMEDATEHPAPASGPYEITEVKGGRGWSYARNPEWAGNNAKLMPQLPSGNVDEIEMTVNHNAETQVNDVENDKVDWMQNPPPSDRLPELREKYEGTQLEVTPSINVFYFWMNTTEPPFDDLRVRRAVNYAIDPRALSRIWAGAMKPMQQILPPAMPGHRDFTPYPHDMAKAKALIAAADPAERSVTVWTNSFPINREAGEYYEGVLKELGFETKLKVIDPSNYFTVTGNLSTPDLDTGYGNWLLDYPHPNDYFEPQLTGEAIAETNNTNWSQFDDPALDTEVERLRQEQLGPQQEAAYARLDREYMKQAPWAPFGTLSFPTFVSETVDLEKLIVSPIYGQDMTSFVLR